MEPLVPLVGEDLVPPFQEMLTIEFHRAAFTDIPGIEPRIKNDQFIDVNVKDIVLEKINANGKKYPVEKAKGTAKKYNEL